jgi:hypothetical protein
MRAKYTVRTKIYMNIEMNIVFKYSFEMCFPFKLRKTYLDIFSKEFNFQDIFKQDYQHIVITKQESSKNTNSFLQNKQESSKIPVVSK